MKSLLQIEGRRKQVKQGCTGSLQRLYIQRLQSLQNILKQLYQSVSKDDIIYNLPEEMEKYKIDRINEIVLEVLNSQKQKMLIRVLQKYDESYQKIKKLEAENQGLQVKIREEKKGQSKASNQSLKNIAEEKEQYQRENQRLSKLLSQCQQKRVRLEQQIIELRQSKNININIKEKSMNQVNWETMKCQKCIKAEGKIEHLLEQNTLMSQVIQKLKKDGQSVVQELNHQILDLQNRNKQLSQNDDKITKKTYKEQHLIKEEYSRRNQKIEVMRRQIAFLQEELLQVQQQLSIVKQVIVGNVIQDVKKLRGFEKKIRTQVQRYLQQFFEEFSDNCQQLRKLFKTHNRKQKKEFDVQGALKIMNELDNQLDYFIDNQIVAE